MEDNLLPNLEQKLERQQKYIDALIYITVGGAKNEVAYHHALTRLESRSLSVEYALKRDLEKTKAHDRFIKLYGEIKQIQDEYPDLKGW